MKFETIILRNIMKNKEEYCNIKLKDGVFIGLDVFIYRNTIRKLFNFCIVGLNSIQSLVIRQQ